MIQWLSMKMMNLNRSFEFKKKSKKTEKKESFFLEMDTGIVDSCCNVLIAVVALVLVYTTASVAGVGTGYILLTVIALGVIMAGASFTGLSGSTMLMAIIATGVILGIAQTTGMNATYMFLGIIILTMFMGLSSTLGLGGSYMFLGIFGTLIALGIGFYIFYGRANTLPTITPFADMKKEGFYGGPAVGAGIPDCLRTSSEAAKLYSIFANKFQGHEEGSADMRELTLLLSQLSCFKKDLMGVAKQVEATRYQSFDTQLDMEPIAETTARCFAKTIPPRDLDLAFDKWSKRGHFLIVRLCTAANLTEAEVMEAEKLFQALIADVKDVAQTNCLTGTPTINAQTQPREAVAYNPGVEGRDYYGYY